MKRCPNVLFVFGDQWRMQATGYAGDRNAATPNLDRFARASVRFENAVAGCAVCSPFRASLMTGQHPLTHGVFVNDVDIISDAVPLAECFNRAGCHTAYIGKWHVDGRGRDAFVPAERRLGFRFWRGYECSHDYMHSPYYADTGELKYWDGYDAQAQTGMACDYLMRRPKGQPFALFLSWGPPHDPYDSAPESFAAGFRPDAVQLRPNVPGSCAAESRSKLAGYYAHIAALDDCFGRLLAVLRECGCEEDTVVVFASDHGDMLGSQGAWNKQSPWDESQRIPLLLRWPAEFGRSERILPHPLSAPDIMPTLLGLCGIEAPESVEGTDASPLFRGQDVPGLDGALLSLHFPFHQWRPCNGGREYRGVRTERFTYVRDLNGPWLLYDNRRDPCQMTNLCGDPGYARAQRELECMLSRKLAGIGDDFLPGRACLKQRGIELGPDGDVPVYSDRSPVVNEPTGIFERRAAR